MLSHSRVEVAKRRLEILQEWRSWAAELSDEEQRWRTAMPEHVRMVLQNKRPALLQKLATEVLDWPDKEICNDLCKGFRIVGEAPATGIFRTQPKLAVLSEIELMEQCKFLRPAIIGKTRTSAGNDNASELYDITLKEATEKQWLCGPFTYEQVNALLGQSWLPVRRFGVEQKSKLRPIDDFCENRLNSTFTTVDKISLRTMDHITWAALIICKHCLHTGDMKFVLSNGDCLSGAVHNDWKGNCELKVTALDLKSAYKQLPLHEADVPKAVVTILDPGCNQTKYFTMRTLPFGAAASVLHFNRISKLLWALGCKLGLIWASYYDDYPMLCPAMLESSSLSGAKALLNLLGFQYAGDKLFEPSPKADVLGVELDLAMSRRGVVDIRNKQERIHDICQTLDSILESRRLAMHDLRKLGSTGASEVSLDPSQLSALKLLKKRIESGKPRRLQAKPQTRPWILFTDGSLEYADSGAAVANIGALLVSPEGVSRYFGCEVPLDILKSWQVNGREHVIGIIELYACVVALAEWQSLLRGQRTILFVDNYGAQDCLIKGSAGVETWRKLLMVLEDVDDDLFSYLWVTRVPSHSNPADFPSRGSVAELAYLGDLIACTPTCPVDAKAPVEVEENDTNEKDDADAAPEPDADMKEARIESVQKRQMVVVVAAMSLEGQSQRLRPELSECAYWEALQKLIKDGDQEAVRMTISDNDEILKDLWQKLDRFGHLLRKTFLYAHAAGNLGLSFRIVSGCTVAVAAKETCGNGDGKDKELPVAPEERAAEAEEAQESEEKRRRKDDDESKFPGPKLQPDEFE
eukprot:s2741_g9.t1